MNELYEHLDDAKGLPCSKIIVVETKTGALKREIEEKEKLGKEAEEHLQNFAKQMLGDARP